MANLVSKCGIDCGSCPWGPYPRKGMTAERFEKFRNEAKRILGYMPIKTACQTCQTSDAKISKNAKLPNKKCAIRQCVDKAGIRNCAYCTSFPCDTLKATAGLWTRASIEKRLGKRLSEEQYQRFVKPFEGLARLEAIRASLKPEKLAKPPRVSSGKKNVEVFPENLPLSQSEMAAFRAVYDLLAAADSSSMGMQNTTTFAQHQKLEALKASVFRFLWILSSYGVYDEKASRLDVAADVYLAGRGTEKNLAMWPFVEGTVFAELAKLGVNCERVGLKGFKKADLTTGTGYLRGKGWELRMTFAEGAGGDAALKALQIYAQRLQAKYGAKAFSQFRKADMQVLLET